MPKLETLQIIELLRAPSNNYYEHRSGKNRQYMLPTITKAFIDFERAPGRSTAIAEYTRDWLFSQRFRPLL